MKRTFLTGIKILKVRHLKDIEIPLSENEMRHVIFTGKNGSGKTSVLNALEKHFSFIISDNFHLKSECEERCKNLKNIVEKNKKEDRSVTSEERTLVFWLDRLKNWTDGAIGLYDYNILRDKYMAGQFVLAYYKVDRITNVEISDTIEKIILKDKYSIEETPGKRLIRYMVSMKATGAMARQEGKEGRAKEISDWFKRFEDILKKIFDDNSLKLEFDIENFAFTIHQSGHEPFNFNEMSSGYSAIFDIINDLIMRTEKKGRDIEGIVLIDEIETHLHLELQKVILPILTELFPKIQFVVSSHSPFILSSLKNAVIYDLEKEILVENGLNGFPYEGIVEGYFHADRLSVDLSNKFQEYKELISKKELTDTDCAKIMELQIALDEIPDYLSPDIAAEYNQIKLEFESRE